MCGQVGIIFGPRRRGSKEMTHLKVVFAHLLLLSQERGPHATGVSWLKRDGEYSIMKRPQKAYDFVRNKAFRSFLAVVDSNVTWLAGHNRWPTQGSELNNRNNHPILAGHVAGTHNGVLTNVNDLFIRFDLPRSAEVDSEFLFRLADATLIDGRVNVAAFKAGLALCEGEVSAVMASRLNPEEIILIKGNRPLEVRYHEACQVVVYASDNRYLDIALANMRGWKPINLKPMTVTTFSCANLEIQKVERFKLANLPGSFYWRMRP